MTPSLFTDTDALESCVGKRPSGSHLKSISFLDEHCETLLAVSPFSVLGVRAEDGSMHSHLVGGAPGFLAPISDTELGLTDLAGPAVVDGAAVGMLSFVPGYRETLRVNGRLRLGDSPSLQVEEAFLHCAKALIRSSFWGEPEAPVPAIDARVTDLTSVATFLEACPFVSLASVDSDGFADVSPKGDPAGMVAQVVDASTLVIADRPGNRRTDTMHNLIGCDSIGLLAMVPGGDQVVEVRGSAGVTDDEELRGRLAVNGKVPTAAVVVTAEHVEVRTDAAFGAAALWDPSRHLERADLPKATQVWADHVKRNDDPGIGNRIARRVVTEKMIDRGVEKDYRENLY
ncbi:MAG: pyridoxamine 5'-phosphate oxidase family protein [Actinomycetota bacterium]